jgi:general secretion pathway protein G
MNQTARNREQNRPFKDEAGGFTLIELVIVMTVIGLLASIAIPSYVNSVRRAREAVLREDLHTLRSAIDSYTVDKEQAPQSLDDLVQAGYLKSVPIDPITNHADTWITSQSDALTNISQTQGGMSDVHSGAQGLATDGSTYNNW